MDIWTFDDQYRAIVKGVKTAQNKQPILTGMALGLNSTLTITERNEKLPPCPMILLSNSDGLLQVYYYIHKNLPSLCRPSEVIKPMQGSSFTQSTSNPTPFSQAPSSSSSSNNPLASLLQSCKFFLLT